MRHLFLRRTLSAALLLSSVTSLASAQRRPGGGDVAPSGPTPTIAQRTASLEKKDGFLPFYYDSKTAHVFLEVKDWNKQFL
ncbi:MAG: hypothetical protein V4734_11305, partial [Terriglobus sp.]